MELSYNANNFSFAHISLQYVHNMNQSVNHLNLWADRKLDLNDYLPVDAVAGKTYRLRSSSHFKN